MAGPHVFEDGRLGCWIVNIGALGGRHAKLHELGVTDLFVRGPDGSPALKAAVLAAGFTGCHAWWAVDGLTAAQYAERVLADVARWSPGAGDLNVELGSDPPLEPYMRAVVGAIRAARPSYRLRLVIAPNKAGFLPLELVQSDPSLYVAIENYGGNMTELYDAQEQELAAGAAGVPASKIASMYAAACEIPGLTQPSVRVNTWPIALPPARGVIFHDELLAQAGLL